jgi:hypothetical protein
VAVLAITLPRRFTRGAESPANGVPGLAVAARLADSLSYGGLGLGPAQSGAVYGSQRLGAAPVGWVWLVGFKAVGQILGLF